MHPLVGGVIVTGKECQRRQAWSPLYNGRDDFVRKTVLSS
jgi:hypothetical protein